MRDLSGRPQQDYFHDGKSLRRSFSCVHGDVGKLDSLLGFEPMPEEPAPKEETRPEESTEEEATESTVANEVKETTDPKESDEDQNQNLKTDEPLPPSNPNSSDPLEAGFAETLGSRNRIRKRKSNRLTEN